MLEADPKFKRNMTVCQGIEKVLSTNSKLYDEKASSVQCILDQFFFFNKDMKHFHSHLF